MALGQLALYLFGLRPWHLMCFTLIGDTMLHPNSSVEAWIRSKYEYKRWVMKGPIPDPATLDDGDDETIVVRTLPILIISL